MTIEKLHTSVDELHEMIADLTHTVYRLGAILLVDLPEHSDNMHETNVEVDPEPSSLLDLHAMILDKQTRRLHSTNQAAVVLLESLLHGGPEVPSERSHGGSGTTMRSHLRDEAATRHRLSDDTRVYLQRNYPAQGDVDGPL